MRFAVLTVITMVLMFVVCGCQIIDEPVGYAQPVGEIIPVDNRFVDNTQSSSGSTENAVEWSEKYEKLLAKTEDLTESNNTLSTENTQLKQQVASLISELDKTKTELAEANGFIQEMHVELGNWKSDVLGFRDEMRSAQAAELVALKKILRLLGAEMTAPKETATADGTQQQVKK